jgi:tRNA (adenine57-N1/adenine58-N1)-methyltransferase
MKTGDLVIIYERHDSLDHFYLSAGNILNIKYGHFHHDDFIGKPFGSKILSRTSNGYMYALEPSPELWSLAVHVSITASATLQHYE